MDLTNDTDIWSFRAFDFKEREKAKALELLKDEELLKSFFDRLLQVLTLIEAHSSTSGFDTSLAWDMIRRETVNVMVFGEAGAGKSLLVRTLTGDAGAKSSASTVGTVEERICETPSGVHFIDTPGIKIPLLTEAKADGGFFPSVKFARDLWTWRAMLKDLDGRLLSQQAATRPLALVYVHRASMRVIPERIEELITRSHRRLVPTFLLCTDVCAVDDAALAEVRGKLRGIVRSIGPNKRNKTVEYIEINTETKTVDGGRHKLLSKGLPRFVATLLSNLDPIDALTFTRPPPILGRLGLARLGLPAAIAPTVVTDAQKQEVRNKRARPDASVDDDDDDDSGGGGRSPQSGSGDRRRSKAARRSL